MKVINAINLNILDGYIGIQNKQYDIQYIFDFVFKRL